MQPRIQNIDARSLQELMDADAVVLIDVREAGENARAHIPGGTLAPLSRLGAEPLPEADGKKVVVYCASGARSLMAADRMLADHYGGVYNLDGGISAWQIAGLPVAQDENAMASAFPGFMSLLRGSR